MIINAVRVDWNIEIRDGPERDTETSFWILFATSVLALATGVRVGILVRALIGSNIAALGVNLNDSTGIVHRFMGIIESARRATIRAARRVFGFYAPIFSFFLFLQPRSYGLSISRARAEIDFRN